MKRAKRIAALLLTLALTLSMGLTSVFAQDNYTPIDGVNAKIPIPIKKTLDIHGANAYPAHTVTFSVGTGTAYNRTGTVSATGTVPDVTYTFTGANTDVMHDESSFDFSRIKFPKPGLYKFPVTESISRSEITTVPNSETTYYIYVQVDNIVKTAGASGLEYAPTSYKLVKGSAAQAPGGDPASAAKVTTALFENEYINNALNVKKDTTGNQGDKTKEFTVTVAFSGGANDGEYAVIQVSGTPKVNGTTATSTPIPVAAGSTVTLKLKDTDEVQFYGIPNGVTATVTETDANTANYTSTSSVDGAAATSAVTYTHVFNATTAGDDDHAVTFINNKTGIIPTGIFINNWPYIAMVLVVIAAAAIFVSRRNRKIEDEDL